jgi:hypothetical protein
VSTIEGIYLFNQILQRLEQGFHPQVLSFLPPDQVVHIEMDGKDMLRHAEMQWLA